MGGVGKTLLATLVENEVKRKATFNDVIWVTVSNKFSISKLQDDIAKRIGVKLEEDDERIRSNNLSLEPETKEKLVLILDDVWNYIDLQNVGIPLKVNGIKVIVTTRLKHVCYQMDCLPNHMIQMRPLRIDNEDWRLFEVKLGHDGTSTTLCPKIDNIARQIVEICGGLPLGINVMARTMKGIDCIHQWKHVLNKLKKLEVVQEVEEEFFKVLKRSYDNLKEKDMQKYFIYCALLSIDDWDDDDDDDGDDYEKNNKDELIMKLVEGGHINRNVF
jgi:sentrin-specific protease 7